MLIGIHTWTHIPELLSFLSIMIAEPPACLGILFYYLPRVSNLWLHSLLSLHFSKKQTKKKKHSARHQILPIVTALFKSCTCTTILACETLFSLNLSINKVYVYSICIIYASCHLFRRNKIT